MPTLNTVLDRLEALAASWRGDTAAEPHVSELLDLVKSLRHPDPGPEVIVMQVDAGGDEEEIEVEFPPPFAGMPPESKWYRHGEFVVVCPHPGCTSTQFYEVDRSERWNPMEVDEDPQPDTRQVFDPEVRSVNGRIAYKQEPNPLAGLPVLNVWEGSSGDGYSTAHHMCQTCQERVTLPDWLETEWLA